MADAYCPRCGFRPEDPRFCWYCPDGVADATRARELVEAAADGVTDAHRILAQVSDARSFDVLIEALDRDEWRIRCAALDALGLVGDLRAVRSVIRLLDDPEARVRACAVACLAELGSIEAADALAAALDDESVGAEAAIALAWLGDARGFEPLLAAVRTPRRVDTFFRTTASGLAWFGDRAAVPHLVEALEHAGELLETGEAPRWIVRSHAEAVASTLRWFGGAAAEDALAAAQRRFGGLMTISSFPAPDRPRVFSYGAGDDERRTVAKWSLELRQVDAPIREHVTKFGGQPVWLAEPTWPLTGEDTPMTFLGQFRTPGTDEGMAYLFADVHGSGLSEDGSAVVVVQPGLDPDRFERRATGPAYVSELPGSLSTFKPRMRHGFVESLPALTEGRDPLDWTGAWADEGDNDFDWNKLGGTPRFLQGDERPAGDGWSFLAQFTASLVGHELGDGTECYVFVSDEGRGAFLWQCH